MTLISIIITLVLEQFHALPVQQMVRDPVVRMAAILEDKFNDGGRSHGAIAWGLGVALPHVRVKMNRRYVLAIGRSRARPGSY